jgi:transposase-like protein
LCKSCKRSFSIRNKQCKRVREQIWFKRWIVEGYSVRQLSLQSGHSRDKLYRIINHWLKEEPPNAISNLEKHQYLIFDGTFLHRPLSIVTLMDVGRNQIVSGQYGVSENSERQLNTFFKPLIAEGLNPVSCTVDGNPQAIKVIRTLWPEVIVQRCLVHIQRQGLMWCRRYPKTVYARKLREVFLQVTHIRTVEERNKFLELVIQWERQYGQYIDKQLEKGRVFSDIKRARSMLLKALPDMFHYLGNPNISFTTNGLESYFSRLKGHYRQHRGLRKKKLSNYFNWYFYFKQK